MRGSPIRFRRAPYYKAVGIAEFRCVSLLELPNGDAFISGHTMEEAHHTQHAIRFSREAAEAVRDMLTEYLEATKEEK